VENEVVIHVRVKNEGKTGFEAVGKDADTHARKISESFSKTFSENVNARLRDSRGRFIAAGQGMGDEIGQVAAQRITERITRDVNGRLRDSRGRFISGAGSGGNGGNGGDSRSRGGDGGRGGDATVDVDKQSLFSRFFNTGKEAASKFADGFKSSAESVLSGVFSGDILSTIVKGISIAGLAVLLAPVLGAAITAALGLALGGGVLAAGIAGAFKDPIVAGAAKGTLANLKADLEDFGKTFRAPLEDFFIRFDQLINSLKPQLSSLAKTFGPVLTELETGFIGLLQNALPGIMRAAQGAKPLFDTLADKLPMIGDAIGIFFDHINEGAPDAALFFGDLLEIVGLIIRAFGVLVEMLTIAYRDIRLIIAGVLNGLNLILHVAADAFSWDPILGPKLRSASNKVDEFTKKFNKSFEQLHTDIKVNIRINVVGLSAARAAIDLGAKLAKMGYAHGGVVGAATGGLHSGLRMVGEHGPELLELPPGTRVNSNPDTERMMSGGGGGVLQQIIQLVVDGKVIAQAMTEPLRADIRTLGQGSVQNYLGQPGVA
jgi:hypothetical protein